MRTDDEIHIFGFKSELGQSRLDMVEQRQVARVDQDARRTVDQVGVTIVGRHGLP